MEQLLSLNFLFLGLIYMVGGCTENQRFLSDLLCYNPLTGEWSSLPSMSVARSQMGVTILGDHLYVVGGTNRSQVLTSVERYSFKKVKRTTLLWDYTQGASFSNVPFRFVNDMVCHLVNHIFFRGNGAQYLQCLSAVLVQL